MKTAMLAMGVVTLTTMGASDALAQKTKCANPQLTVEILPIGPDGTGALDGDSKGRTYIEGVDGVYNTVINVCSGSYDSTFGLVTSRRSMVMRFPDHPDGPVWVGSDILAKPYMNVRDLLWGRRNGTATFTTWMTFAYIKGPGDKSDHVLRFKADVTDAPVVRQTESEPGTVPVTVQEDAPVACTGGGARHSWTVTTLPAPAIGALYKSQTDTAAGTYDMPFRLRFTTKGCVTLPW
jgi:hypothetical protein